VKIEVGSEWMSVCWIWSKIVGEIKWEDFG